MVENCDVVTFGAGPGGHRATIWPARHKPICLGPSGDMDRSPFLAGSVATATHAVAGEPDVQKSCVIGQALAPEAALSSGT